MTTLYVSGAMTGRPHHGWPEFIDATARLRAAGYRVISPHELWGEPRPELGRAHLLRCDLIAMLGALDNSVRGYQGHVGGVEGVATLDGWENSQGAKLEVTVARVVDIDCRPLEAWLSETIGEGAHPGKIDAARTALDDAGYTQ